MRTAGDVATVTLVARAAITAAAPEIVIRSVRPMSEIVAFSVGREQALRTVALVFSIVAVGLAAIGLYGVMAFQVTSRSREIGIRMALGADRPKVVRMVMRESLLVVAAGVAQRSAGITASSGSGPALRRERSPPHRSRSAAWFSSGPASSLLPSRNASRVDLMMAIRSGASAFARLRRDRGPDPPAAYRFSAPVHRRQPSMTSIAMPCVTDQ